MLAEMHIDFFSLNEEIFLSYCHTQLKEHL